MAVDNQVPHELDCLWGRFGWESGAVECGGCITARDAYKHGREDAARDARSKWLEIAAPSGARHYIASLIADAASGNGEQ
jgi:hypothetical protein